MKNWDPFVLGPAFAMERRPGVVCLSLKFSSGNIGPYMDSPPVPSPLVKSPPCNMNCGMRWNLEPLYVSSLPDLPLPFSPVHSARKFSTVL